MPIAKEIDSAVGAHGLWKSRLRSAIETGKTDRSVDEVRASDRCDFGRWLGGGGEIDRTCQHFATVRDLHAKFHLAAAEVLTLALAGQRAKAEASMAMNGAFSDASIALTNAMRAWKKTAS